MWCAVEVLSGGVLPAPHKPLPFLVDELLCKGNETSLMHCDQAGWGVHDCLPEEVRDGAWWVCNPPARMRNGRVSGS